MGEIEGRPMQVIIYYDDESDSEYRRLIPQCEEIRELMDEIEAIRRASEEPPPETYTASY
jgi:hypothetical protein